MAKLEIYVLVMGEIKFVSHSNLTAYYVLHLAKANGKKLKNLQHHHKQVFPWLNICSNFVLVFAQPLPPQKSNCAPNFAKLVSCVILFARIVGDLLPE